MPPQLPYRPTLLEPSVKRHATLVRLAAATATAAALLLAGATTAAAAPDTPGPTATSIRPADATPPDRTPLASLYRGIQGGNLCLLARCTLGGSEGSAEASNTQGANICLLAVCSVRP